MQHCTAFIYKINLIHLIMPDPEFPGKPPHKVVLHSEVGRSQYFRLGWELLCSGGLEEVRIGGFGRHGTSGPRALQPSTRLWGAQSLHFGEHWRRSVGLVKRWGHLQTMGANGRCQRRPSAARRSYPVKRDVSPRICYKP
jgi:hypothetical protein